MKRDCGDQVEGRVILGTEEEEDELVLPGFRFHPTDEELVTFYLRRKIAGKRLRIEIIKEMDIYKHDPSDFLNANTLGGEKEWYFFCLRGRKYRNSIRPNRVTSSGFWKATGIDRPICAAAGDGGCIGLKKSLVYYRGSAGKGTKTDWMMHEFRLPPPRSDDRAAAGSSPPPSLQEAEVWTICRIFQRNLIHKKQPITTATVALLPDSSSITGSLESDCAGDVVEYMNSLPQQQAPASNMNNSGYYPEYFQEQWNSIVHDQLPAMAHQPSLAMSAFHDHSILSSRAPSDLYCKDGYNDDICRMVMELADPSLLYDYRYT
ncbi:hypothetical protein GUJ93_ZPchr0013g33936 [Zizania palustris]|uniref:NAC domain-containing protein n=1 Tax=Zizania palustris TaxID=103762 RepID=A0A8J6C3R9_ZIZPA|nr:hypothetical protein GUJ93_ZPchr0013g33936 [Zizania palustris]